jgi:hypothetical protein
VKTVGFLHTSAVHVRTFGALLAEIAPGTPDVHLVDEQLLADAVTQGVDASIQTRLEGRLRELAEHAPGVIVCTCSTFSGHAERLAEELGIAVLRIDRPMAERAVALGGRVAVVATVASTLGPTRELFDECAAGTAAVVVEVPCPGAWAAFEGGDLDGYYASIARHVRGLAGDFDVVVLAQASMAPAAALLADLAIPVLTSPRLAVLRAVELVRSA